MRNSEINNDMEKLFNKYRIGNIIEDPKSISGGLMHKIFKVKTETNVYAIKWLNPSVMQRSGVMENMINSERIANVFSKYLPVVAALNIENQIVLHSNNKYYMIFDWIEGNSMFPPLISKEHCYAIGSLLGRMHQLDITVVGVNKDNSESILYDWNGFMVKGKKQKAYWIDTYANIIDKLSHWNILDNEANSRLSENMLISHRDLDPKNVMWHKNKPYFIDWEAAGYINPHQELLEVLNYWANDGKGELDRENFNTLLNAYKEYMSITEVDWDGVLNRGYGGMLGWLEYSLKRALGIESVDEEEKALGAEQVAGTITELEGYDNRVRMLKEWLS